MVFAGFGAVVALAAVLLPGNTEPGAFAWWWSSSMWRWVLMDVGVPAVWLGLAGIIGSTVYAVRAAAKQDGAAFGFRPFCHLAALCLVPALMIRSANVVQTPSHLRVLMRGEIRAVGMALDGRSDPVCPRGLVNRGSIIQRAHENRALLQIMSSVLAFLEYFPQTLLP